VVGFCRYLPEFGIQPVVLTVEERFYRVRDETVPVPQGVQVVRTSFANPLHWYRRLRSHLRRNHKLSVVQEEVPSLVTKSRVLRRQLLALLEVPDEYWGWYFPAIRAAEKLIRAGSIAAILSTGPPWTPHLVARHLKKKYRIPWLADFRDAWTFDCWRAEPRWRDTIDRRLEASCLRWADLVMSTTDAIRDTFLHEHPCLPASKFSTLTNGFDRSPLVTTPRRADNSPSLLVHTGKLYANRRIDGFCKALQDLVNAGKLASNDFKVLFLGDTDDSLMAGAQQVAPALIENGSIQFVKRVPWQEARQILERAAVLLVFQGNQRLAIPAKFYDYLGTGKPILAVVQKGALTEILQATGSGLWADPADSVAIADKLLAALAMPPRSAREQASLARKYHYRSLTEQLAAQIREIGLRVAVRH
jgi:glycosyltransferase involved in cell wall biosynthesis